jgi:hypothetical protein
VSDSILGLYNAHSANSTLAMPHLLAELERGRPLSIVMANNGGAAFMGH